MEKWDVGALKNWVREDHCAIARKSSENSPIFRGGRTKNILLNPIANRDQRVSVRDTHHHIADRICSKADSQNSCASRLGFFDGHLCPHADCFQRADGRQGAISQHLYLWIERLPHELNSGRDSAGKLFFRADQR